MGGSGTFMIDTIISRPLFINNLDKICKLVWTQAAFFQ